MPGYLFYDGPSNLDDSDIIGIATYNSNNPKTGDMVQTWILPKHINPLKSTNEGSDKAVCGNCKHRPANNGTCYVALHHAPNNIYKKYRKRYYPKLKDFRWFEGKLVRFGAWGDPTAIPIPVWQNILKFAKGHTSYVHQWKQTKFQKYKAFSMASVDSPQEQAYAHRLGWRTFRIKTAEETKLAGEAVCPASHEAGHKLTCATCLLCNGAERHAKDIVINIHGLPYKVDRFKTMVNKMKVKGRYSLDII